MSPILTAPCRPWFNWGYDLESEHEFMYPMMPWDYGRGGVGGSDTAASGVQESYKIRRDYLIHWRLLVDESEIPVFDTMLDWMQDSATTFFVRADVEVEATEREAYLESCRWQDGELRYPRDTRFNGAFIIPMSLRTAAGAPWGLSWTDLATESV